MSKIYKSIQINDKKIISNTQNFSPSVSNDLINNDEIDEANKISSKIISEAKIKAKKIINNADEQVEQLIHTEKLKIDEWWENKRKEDSVIMNDAREKGYHEGLKQAEDEINKKSHDLIEQAQQILHEGYKIKEQTIQESEFSIIELSTEIAEKIITRELELNQDIIKDMIKEVLKKTKEFEKITIYVSIDYFSYLQNVREELLTELNGQVELLIFPDPSLTSAGCLIKTSNGTIDVKVDTQLEEIKKLLFEVLGRRKG